MTEESFKVVISGYYHVELTGYETNKGEYYIEKDFAEFMHIPRQQARQLIQRSKKSPKVLVRNLPIDKAIHLRDKIEITGVCCEVLDMDSHHSDELSLAPD